MQISTGFGQWLEHDIRVLFYLCPVYVILTVLHLHFSQSVDCHFFGLVLSQEVVLAHFHWLCSLLLQSDSCVFYKGNVLTWFSVWCDRAHSVVPGASVFPHHLSHSLHSVPTKLTQQANSAWTRFSFIYLQSQSICQTGGSNSWHQSST